MLISFLIVVCAFLPNIAWLMFYVREDAHPEPKPLLVAAFALGIVSVGAVYGLQRLSVSWLSNWLTAPANVIMGSYIFIICAAFIEEIVKFVCGQLMIWKNPVFEEPIDAMIYMVVIGLGFAFTENILYLRNFSATVFDVVNLAMLRFISANLLHAVCSGLAGYFWARGIVARAPWRGALAGVFWAGLVHVLYNVMILALQNQFIIDIPILFILIIGLYELRNFELLRRLSSQVVFSVYGVKTRAN